MSRIGKSLAAAAGAVLLLSAAGAQAAGVSDNFEGYGDATVLNFTGFTNLTVSTGTVDLIGTPNGYGLSTPYGNGFVDLDGSTDSGGTLRTSTFSFNTGDVVSLSFDLSGNQRGGSPDDFSYGFETSGGAIVFNNLSITNPPLFGTIDFGNFGTGPAVSSGFGALPSDEPWEHYSIQFTAGNSGSLTAFVGTGSNDDIGPLLDNFNFNISSGVPEPGAWALMLVGVGVTGFALRRRTAVASAA